MAWDTMSVLQDTVLLQTGNNLSFVQTVKMWWGQGLTLVFEGAKTRRNYHRVWEVGGVKNERILHTF